MKGRQLTQTSGLHIHMCAFIHTCVPTHIHIQIHTYIGTHTHLYPYVCIHTCMCTYTCLYPHIHVYIHMCICTHTFVYTHVHIHTYICTYSHTHTHTIHSIINLFLLRVRAAFVEGQLCTNQRQSVEYCFQGTNPSFRHSIRFQAETPHGSKTFLKDLSYYLFQYCLFFHPFCHLLEF